MSQKFNFKSSKKSESNEKETTTSSYSPPLDSQIQTAPAPYSSQVGAFDEDDYDNMQDQFEEDFGDDSNSFFPKSSFCACCQGYLKSCPNCVAQQGFPECQFCQLSNLLLDSTSQVGSSGHPSIFVAPKITSSSFSDLSLPASNSSEAPLPSTIDSDLKITSPEFVPQLKKIHSKPSNNSSTTNDLSSSDPRLDPILRVTWFPGSMSCACCIGLNLGCSVCLKKYGEHHCQSCDINPLLSTFLSSTSSPSIFGLSPPLTSTPTVSSPPISTTSTSTTSTSSTSTTETPKSKYNFNMKKTAGSTNDSTSSSSYSPPLASQIQTAPSPYSSQVGAFDEEDYENMQDQFEEDFEDGSNNFFPQSRYCACCQGCYKSCPNCVAQQGFSECELCQLPNPLFDPAVKHAHYSESADCLCCKGYNLSCPNCQDCEGVCQECAFNPLFVDYKISVSEWVEMEDGSLITSQEFDATMQGNSEDQPPLASDPPTSDPPASDPPTSIPTNVTPSSPPSLSPTPTPTSSSSTPPPISSQMKLPLKEFVPKNMGPPLPTYITTNSSSNQSPTPSNISLSNSLSSTSSTTESTSPTTEMKTISPPVPLSSTPSTTSTSTSSTSSTSSNAEAPKSKLNFNMKKTAGSTKDSTSSSSYSPPLASQVQTAPAPYSSQVGAFDDDDYDNMQDQFEEDFEDGSNNFFPESRYCACCQGYYKSCPNCVAQQGFSECELCQLPNPLFDPAVKHAHYSESAQCTCCEGYNLSCPNCQDCEGVCQECAFNPLFVDYKISVSEWVEMEDGAIITSQEFDAMMQGKLESPSLPATTATPTATPTTTTTTNNNNNTPPPPPNTTTFSHPQTPSLSLSGLSLSSELKPPIKDFVPTRSLHLPPVPPPANTGSSSSDPRLNPILRVTWFPGSMSCACCEGLNLGCSVCLDKYGEHNCRSCDINPLLLTFLSSGK